MGSARFPLLGQDSPTLLENLQPFVKGIVKNRAAAPYKHICPPPCKETGTGSPPALASLPMSALHAR